MAKLEQEQYYTKAEMIEYLKNNLKLETKSERIHPQDSKYKYQITLKLEGQQISGIQFIA